MFLPRLSIRLVAALAAGLMAAAVPALAQAADSPAQVDAAARAAVAEAGLVCNVTGSVARGKVGRDKAYEVSCADAPGWMVVTSKPIQTFNCLATAAAVASGAMASDLCTLPANGDAVANMRGIAAALNITCAIDQVEWIGRQPNEFDRYEIGCADVGGYWVTVDLTGAPKEKLDCLEVSAAGRACKFTTEAEINAGFNARLAGTTAAPCNVTKVRLVGDSATDRFYEAVCAGSDGLMISFSLANGAFSGKYECARAQRVVGGCKLTTAPPAAG